MMFPRRFGRVECPLCPKTLRRSGKTLGIELEITERNAHGSYEDIANCPECGKGFVITYGITSIVHEEGWDGETRAEREADAKKRQQEAEEKELRDAEAIIAKYAKTPIGQPRS